MLFEKLSTNGKEKSAVVGKRRREVYEGDVASLVPAAAKKATGTLVSSSAVHSALINTKKIGEKRDGVAKGYLGVSIEGQKYLIKYIARGVINYIPNAINEFVSYPLLHVIFQGSNVVCPFIGLQRATSQSAPGIAVEFIDGTRSIKKRATKPMGLETVCAVRAVVGDDDWCPSNVLESANRMVSVDNGKAFMARPDSPSNFMEYFNYLFKRWYGIYNLDNGNLSAEFKRILQAYTENRVAIHNAMSKRVAILKKELGDDCLRDTIFVLRTRDGCWPVERRFNSFEEYFAYVQEMLEERMSMLPEVITLLDEKILQEASQQKDLSFGQQFHVVFKPIALSFRFNMLANTCVLTNAIFSAINSAANKGAVCGFTLKLANIVKEYAESDFEDIIKGNFDSIRSLTSPFIY